MIGWFLYLLLWVPLNLFRLVWWRWKIEGRENLPPRPQGIVLAINHLHWNDVLVAGASLPLSHRPWWIAKAELFSGPMGTWFFRQMQCIPIKRGRRDLAALEASEEALKQGVVLIVFPEGHRSDTGQLQPGRGGAVRLAIRSGCPIVPVAVWGTEAGLGKTWLRHPITVRFGKPYHPSIEGDSIPFDRMNELTDEMMMRIAELMPERYWGHYRERMLAAPTPMSER